MVRLVTNRRLHRLFFVYTLTEATSSQLPAAAKFCPECAPPVSGATVGQPRFASPESYTPKHLAEKILTSKAALEGERKLVTVYRGEIVTLVLLAAALLQVASAGARPRSVTP